MIMIGPDQMPGQIRGIVKIDQDLKTQFSFELVLSLNVLAVFFQSKCWLDNFRFGLFFEKDFVLMSSNMDPYVDGNQTKGTSATCFLQLSCPYFYSIVGLLIGLFLCCLCLYRTDQRRHRVYYERNAPRFGALAENNLNSDNDHEIMSVFPRTESTRVVELSQDNSSDVEIRPTKMNNAVSSAINPDFSLEISAQKVDGLASANVSHRISDAHLSEPFVCHDADASADAADTTLLPPSASKDDSMREILDRLDVLVQRNEDATGLSSVVQKLELLFQSDPFPLSAPGAGTLREAVEAVEQTPASLPKPPRMDSTPPPPPPPPPPPAEVLLAGGALARACAARGTAAVQSLRELLWARAVDTGGVSDQLRRPPGARRPDCFSRLPRIRISGRRSARCAAAPRARTAAFLRCTRWGV